MQLDRHDEWYYEESLNSILSSAFPDATDIRLSLDLGKCGDAATSDALNGIQLVSQVSQGAQVLSTLCQWWKDRGVDHLSTMLTLTYTVCAYLHACTHAHTLAQRFTNIRTQTNTLWGRCQARWPVNTVITGPMMQKYSECFLFLMQLKRAKWAVSTLSLQGGLRCAASSFGHGD